jgi:multiple sugar transport system permease protein
MSRTRKPGISAILPVLILIALIGLSPFVSALWNSFFHDSYGVRSFAGLDNFRYITADDGFRFSLNITVLWAFLSAVLTLVFGFLIATRLVESRRSSGMLFRVLLIPWGIPVYIAVPLWRAFLHGNGGESVLTRLTGLSINLMTNPSAGFLGALAVSLWMSIPLSAFVLAAHIKTVPRQVLEAARLDGASTGQIAVHVYLPAIRESLLALGLRNFIVAFKEFTLVFLMTAGGPPLVQGITQRHIIGATTTLGVFLYEIFQGTSDWGISSAYALMMALIVILAMVVWAVVKRKKSLWPLLVLAAVAQLPGGDPVLWAFMVIYAVSLRWPRLVSWAAILQVGYTAYRVAAFGFLAGFHPGLLVALVAAVAVARSRLPSPAHLTGPARGRFGRRTIGVLPAGGVTAASAVTAALVTVLTAAILYLLVWMSLSRVSAVYVNTLLPTYPTVSNYVRLFREEGIFRYFGNTVVIAGITALLLPLAVFPGAVWLQRRGRKLMLIFLGVVQMLEMAGGMHSLIPLYRLFLAVGLVNSFVPLILIYLYHALPFSLFVLTAYLESVPSVFRDIAVLEGMSVRAYSFRILLPLSLPALLTAVMAALIGAWNGFMPALLFLNDENLYPISMKLYGWVGSLASGRPVWNLFAAASVVNTVLVGALLLRFRNPMKTTALREAME